MEVDNFSLVEDFSLDKGLSVEADFSFVCFCTPVSFAAAVPFYDIGTRSREPQQCRGHSPDLTPTAGNKSSSANNSLLSICEITVVTSSAIGEWRSVGETSSCVPRNTPGMN